MHLTETHTMYPTNDVRAFMRTLTMHAIHVATASYVMHERTGKGRSLFT